MYDKTVKMITPQELSDLLNQPSDGLVTVYKRTVTILDIGKDPISYVLDSTPTLSGGKLA